MKNTRRAPIEELKMHLEAENWDAAAQTMRRVKPPESLQAIKLALDHWIRGVSQTQSKAPGNQTESRRMFFTQMLKTINRQRLFDTPASAELAINVASTGLATRHQDVLPGVMNVLERIRTGKHYAKTEDGRFNLKLALTLLGFLHRLDEHSEKLFTFQQPRLLSLIDHVEKEITKGRYLRFRPS